MKIADALEEAIVALADAGVGDPRREAGSLLAFSLKKDRAFLHAHPEYELSRLEVSSYCSNVERRARREPYQYIVGTQEFYGLEFEVTSDVLIPRPETEILVEKAIEFLAQRSEPFFCEIGVGSGCISVSILRNLPEAQAVAGDISKAALEVARSNAQSHDVDDRIEFIISDVFESTPEARFDAIVSNPPYVPEIDFESLQVEVRDHEPAIALLGGSSGLEIIGRIIDGAGTRLVDGGLLLMEIGFNQFSSVNRLLATDYWRDIEILPDLQGIPRVAKALKR